MTRETEGVGSLCARRPLAVPVLHDLGLVLADPDRSLAACCLARGVDEELATAAITAAEVELTGVWHGCPVSELLDHILRTYHRPLAHEVAEVVETIEAARAVTHHASWTTLLAALEELRADLDQHIEMEERVVFPWLRGRAASATGAMRAMQLEHADAIALLLTLEVSRARCLAAEPENPHDEAVATRLRRFERWLCEHIHLESNELFPRALHAEITRR